ncbi:MAG TPA: delta(1)-pyrroline-2-carboxylate reductase family protein [Trueperaceae bacterium]|nr:delta(1)-pyrroline-2-carboxylate reductase family protein [Trueperaceae bacterium]
MSYTIYDAAETAALLPYGALRDELAAVLAEHERGELFLKERVILPLPNGTLLAMPASDARLSITKVVTVHPGNSARGIPTISGEVIVARADDGTRLGLLHGGTVTMRRTAALSLLAARLMGVEDRPAEHLLVIGAGDQARGHLEAFTEELSIQGVTIASRTAQRAEELASAMRGRGVAATTVAPGTPEFVDAVLRSDIIVTATTSSAPVVSGDVRADASVFAVGAYRSDMAELSPAIVAGARRVVVDTLAGAQHEAGELIQAAAAGVWEWSAAQTLLGLLAESGAVGHHARQAGAAEASPVGPPAVGGHQVFKSVGHAMYDLAAARVAFRNA